MNLRFLFFFAPAIFLFLPGAAGQGLKRNTQVSGVCYAGDKVKQLYIPPPDVFYKKGTKGGGKITVIYTGFTNQSKAAVNYAVSILESILPADTRVTIKASYERITTAGVLGNSTITGYASGWGIDALDPFAYYPVALAEKIAGTTLNTDDEGDIVLKINSSVNWYFGTDGKAGTAYDLITVVLHEICHGLGFYDSMSTEGANGFYGLGGVPMIYDTFINDQQGQRLTDTMKYHNYSPQLLQKMENGPLYFKGKVTGNQVKIYTPETFDDGSSISHLDEASYKFENALMTPYIDKGEAIHDPGLIVRKVLGDIGWINTRIIHTSLKDTEAALSQVQLSLEIKSDTTYNHNLVGLVYSWNNFATRDTLYLTESTTPGQFSVTLPVPSYNSGLQYYLFAIDYFSRIYKSPSLISEFRYKAYIGVDTVRPIMIHTPVGYCLQNNDTVDINVAADDNIGIDSVYMEYRINDGPVAYLGLKHGAGYNYSAYLETRKLGFKGGDSIRYRIHVIDAAAGKNSSVLPKSDYYKFRVEEIWNPVETYSTDFSSSAKDFFNIGFSISKPSGFSHFGLHTKHPYESPETDNGSINYTSILRYPVKITSSGLLINFDEVVLVEPGETGSVYGSSDFYDFVIVEASKDAGKTWFGLADGYDSRYNQEWEKDYNSAITDMNSSYAGNEAMMQKHTIYLATSEKIKAGDTIMIRFRLYSDPFAHGWGWAIENLRMNPLIDNIEEPGTTLFKVWPNPGSGIINVDLPDDRLYNYSVYNTSGICLRKGTMGSVKGNSLVLSGYPSGLYFIVINDGKSNYVLRYSLIR